jgi:hypothetical protein
MDKEDKSINYFLLSVLILKNGLHELIEEHGIISKEYTPESQLNRLKDAIKRTRLINYPNDSHEVIIQSWDRTTKTIYEAKFGS